jgi:hypothetical protein
MSRGADDHRLLPSENIPARISSPQPVRASCAAEVQKSRCNSLPAGSKADVDQLVRGCVQNVPAI